MSKLEAILVDRGAKYGPYDQMAKVSQQLKSLMYSDKMTLVQRESLDMIATKIARIVCGDPDELDSWVDIGGYAELVIKDIKAKRVVEI